MSTPFNANHLIHANHHRHPRACQQPLDSLVLHVGPHSKISVHHTSSRPLIPGTLSFAGATHECRHHSRCSRPRRRSCFVLRLHQRTRYNPRLMAALGNIRNLLSIDMCKLLAQWKLTLRGIGLAKISVELHLGAVLTAISSFTNCSSSTPCWHCCR